MAEAVVALVAEGIKPLGELIIQQGIFLSGVGNQVDTAQIELQLIRGFLKDADRKQQDEELVRTCVTHIRDAAYDLEDVIECFALKVTSRKRGGAVVIVLKRFACIFSEGVDRYKIGSDIEDIMAKLSRLKSNLVDHGIRQVRETEGLASSRQRQRDSRLTYAHEVEGHLVGLEAKTGELVKELMTEGKRHLVVSIWGMGGSGKTTLAKQVFLHNEVKRHFHCFAWVCISQQCEGRDVLKEILIKLTAPTPDRREQIAKMEKDEVAEKVCSIQQEKRCLVVLDDIWTREAWNSIKAGFPIHGETESRILLTTRKKEVALLASGNDHLHQPQQLDEKQSWELFEKIAIPAGKDKTDSVIYAKKRELGEKMLRRCSRLPLAIRVLAGLLSRRDTIEDWETVHRSVDKYIRRGTNILERETTDQEDGVSGVLALSYDDLPSQLKLCFLYLTQFPEDHEILVKRLTQMWIAEGFITSGTEIHGSTETMEDLAYDCLTELVERSMVHVGKCGSLGKVKTCRLHDLMRDLCLRKAKDENFLDIVNFSTSAGVVSNTRPIGKVRRLALYLDGQVPFEFSIDGRDDHLRSLLFFAPEYFHQKWKKRIIRSVFNDYKLLRVLKFENIDREFELPKTIGNLVHLRFLSLKNSRFRGLPSSISNLVLLQTLDLRGQFLFVRSCFGFTWSQSVCKIRNVFWNMEQLRHLYLPRWHSVSGGKLSFARLCNLQTLVNVKGDTCDLNDLFQLTNLRSLSLGCIPSDIVLRCPPNLYKLRLDEPMRELPKGLLDLPNLTKLTLCNTILKGDQIEILEKLPNLRVLYLYRDSFESETLIFSQGGFPRLEFLDLSGLFDLKEWRVEKEALRSLRRMRIVNCSQLRAVADGVEDITTLQELTIEGMPRRFCRRVEEGGEDFHIIKHVTSLIITNIRPDKEEEDKEVEREEAGGACQVVGGNSHRESTVDGRSLLPTSSNKF